MLKYVYAMQAIFAALLLIGSSASMSQTITATVHGTVTDQSGAVIVKASVSATNVATNQTTATVTNRVGAYSVPFLQIGRYKVTVEARGFATQTFGPFTLSADQNAEIDAKMSVPGSSQQVVVNSNTAPLLNTENAALGTTLDSTAIQNIPLNGQNFVSLTTFVPGAVSSNLSALTGNVAITGMDVRGTANGSPVINGNRQQDNMYILDGIEINETIRNTVGYNPSPEALEQVKTISSNAPAEYGNVNGGEVLAITKSGTNAWHGGLYDFLENHLLDANSWANKHGSTVIPKSSYTQMIFVGTLGGPIIKNKLFFFADYDGGRYHSGGLGEDSVATAKMRTGDFSELLDPSIMCNGTCTSSKSLIQLYDPTNNFAPYAGNLNVPITNPVAQYFYAHPQYYPLPNRAPSVDSPVTDNYVAPEKNASFNNQGDIKIDWEASNADRVSVRYSQSDSASTSVDPLAISFPLQPYSLVKGIAINWVHTFGPSLVNQYRMGFNRIVSIGGFPPDTTGNFGLNGDSILGIGPPPGGQAKPTFVEQSFNDLTALGNAGTGTNFSDNSFTYGDDLIWQKGRHSITLGVEFLRYQENSYYPGNAGILGTFTYDGDYTSNPGANSTTNPNGYGSIGWDVADFNLDRIESATLGGFAGDTGQRQWRDAYYFQDDYQLLRKLTLNLGLRYEYDQPIYEVNNKQVGFNFGTGTLLYAGVNGASRGLYNPSYDDLMPRIGFAYSYLPRLVVRGGFGIDTFLEGTGANLRPTINPPFQVGYAIEGTAPSATNAGQFFMAENAFSTPATPAAGLTYNIWDPNLQPEFNTEYSLTLEYQLNNSDSFQVGYVGQTGQHLVTAGRANQLKQPCVINGVVSATPNSAECALIDPAPYQAVVGQSGSIVDTASDGFMDYNGLQASFRRVLSRGLQFSVNYAYSKNLANNSGFFGAPGVSDEGAYSANYYNNHAEYGPAPYDVRHNLNETMVYELPFGRGRRFGARMNGLFDGIAGGWSFSFTGIFYTGFPITISNTTNNVYENNSGQKTNHYRPLRIVHRGVDHWFGTDPSATGCGLTNNGVCAYGEPANGTYGDSRNGSERAPGFQQFDLSLAKTFHVVREQTIGFRADASNAFNLTSWADPTATAQSTSFGLISSVRSMPRQMQLSLKYQF